MHKAVALVAAVALAGLNCSDSPSPAIAPVVAAPYVHGNLRVEFRSDPFAFVIRNQSGDVLLESAAPQGGAQTGAEADALAAYAPVSITHNEDQTAQVPMVGWDYYRGYDGPWGPSAKLASSTNDGDARVLRVALKQDGEIAIRFEPNGEGMRIRVDAPESRAGQSVNRVSLGFQLHGDDHFFGFGERFVGADARGKMRKVWVEDGGLGRGENEPPGPKMPSPGGEGQTNIPIPWFMSPRGFGMLVEGTYRSVFHLGEEVNTAWRVESWSRSMTMTLFADPDPKILLEHLSAMTGRPPHLPDWALAPRRRADPGTDEMDKLRAAKVPTSVIDTALHYFPSGLPIDRASVRALTADIHRRGFKAIAYFCPNVAETWHPVFDEAAAKGYLVKRPDGSPYTVLVLPEVVGLVDFTNPDAVRWYQGFMREALEDGWDGWMYDFAEYLPLDAVMFDGSTGAEAHNRYPLLYQRAAFDLLESERKGDYLIFARSGFAGTGGLVPMVWGGDQDTDFGLADGLPAALAGALNAGMSGIPIWGSDISGYHFLFTTPPDKELYIRWTELGAFSADMHDENDGAGDGGREARWQIWKDDETLSAYRKYAALKTRMIPYLKLATRTAERRGLPVMRHLYLDYPRDPTVYALTNQYMFGDSLLVAPVVERGKRVRAVYLPEAEYFDYWSGVRIKGQRTVQVEAALDHVPVFAKVGAIVPLLAEDIETLLPVEAGSATVSLDARRDVLEVEIFAGGTTKIVLDDGTALEQTAPLEAFAAPSSIATANGEPMIIVSNENEWTSCDSCARVDATARRLDVKLATESETWTCGPLSWSVKNPSGPRRMIFHVHY